MEKCLYCDSDESGWSDMPHCCMACWVRCELCTTCCHIGPVGVDGGCDFCAGNRCTICKLAKPAVGRFMRESYCADCLLCNRCGDRLPSPFTFPYMCETCIECLSGSPGRPCGCSPELDMVCDSHKQECTNCNQLFDHLYGEQKLCTDCGIAIFSAALRKRLRPPTEEEERAAWALVELEMSEEGQLVAARPRKKSRREYSERVAEFVAAGVMPPLSPKKSRRDYCERAAEFIAAGVMLPPSPKRKRNQKRKI